MDYWRRDQIKIPKLGFGSYGLSKQEAAAAVKQALDCGFRLIDTAPIYLNEEEVGRGIRESSVSREDVFLTTKIWRTRLQPEEIKKSFQESLCGLQTGYVDLLLIHWPNPLFSLQDSLEAFQELQKEGKVKFIGVSNFPCELLKQAKALCPSLITNQVEYHPLLSQKKLLDFAEKEKMFLTAYRALMDGKIFKIQQVADIAKKYDKSISQIVFRWLAEQKNVVSLCRSAKKSHLEEILRIFDFELDDFDRRKLFRLTSNRLRTMTPPFAPAEWSL